MDKYGNATDQLRADVRAMREMADSGFDISKEISEVRELAKEKVAAFKDFREKVEKVVEYNQNLRCAVADLIGENERLREIISSCRCADCGDELGRDWSVNNGVAFCNYCAGGDEDDNV
ncbi:hypothetical protein ES965_21445 (plasmid) [Bacillus subtilis]|uniref:hypothetical protein n=1 Tax=Bacillus subtilis TaxID=1423 RepID=UPI00100A2182|nr:hypothetical protein [Bacillus subtilis]QAV85219.1 hypothetical protein ES965_14505 [Bacillus subtilis]QAV86644.1 hypothetical protein ES965_21445 [Bacillus subtilis]WJD91333.1 hypothetical protein QR321_14460 [Bacillus spizizenii]